MGLDMVTGLGRGGHTGGGYDRRAAAGARAEGVGAAGVVALGAPVGGRGALAAALGVGACGGARALAEDGNLSGLEGYVEDSGEGRWTLHEGIDRGVPLPVLTAALFTRFRSREDNPFSERMLAALRNQFGGHAVKKSS